MIHLSFLFSPSLPLSLLGGRNRSTTTATHIFSFFSPCIELEAQLFPPLPTDLSVWTSFSQCVFAGFEFPAKLLDSIQCSERRSKDGIARQLSLPPIFPFRFPQIDPFTLMCKRREGRNRATGEGHENRKLRVVREKSSLHSNRPGWSFPIPRQKPNESKIVGPSCSSQATHIWRSVWAPASSRK